MRVVLADYKVELGEMGVEMGNSFEMVTKHDIRRWKRVNWETDVAADAGDAILLRPVGVHTPGWEIDAGYL